MKTLAIFLLLASQASAALLWELNGEGGDIGGGPFVDHTASFGVDSSGSVGRWVRYVTPADIGLAVDVDPEKVETWERVLNGVGTGQFGGTFLKTNFIGGKTHLETSWVNPPPPLALPYTTIRHAPLLGPNLSGYSLTGVTHTLNSMEHIDWDHRGSFQTIGTYTMRFYGEPVSPVPGDFNADREVDAADYVLWRNRNGTDGALYNESGLTPYDVTQEDYDFWRSQYGGVSTPAATGLTTAGIPEPATILLIAGVLLIAVLPRYQRST